MARLPCCLRIRFWIWLCVGLGFVPGIVTAAGAQTPATPNDVLMEMASHAAVVFAGEVEAVERHDASGFVDVRFLVTQAVRGCHAGRRYVLREWAGRWAGRADRYVPGQKLLMLLPERGPSGMSAPLYGGDGAIPIVAGAAGPAGPADANMSAPVAVVDLSLLAARVPRSVEAGVISPVRTAVRWGDPPQAAVAPTRLDLQVALGLLQGSVYVPQ